MYRYLYNRAEEAVVSPLNGLKSGLTGMSGLAHLGGHETIGNALETSSSVVKRVRNGVRKTFDVGRTVETLTSGAVSTLAAATVGNQLEAFQLIRSQDDDTSDLDVIQKDPKKPKDLTYSAEDILDFDQHKFIKTLVRDAKSRFPIESTRTTADRLAIRRWLLHLMEERGLRPTHINRLIESCVALVCVPNSEQRQTKTVRSGWLARYRLWRYGVDDNM